MATRVDIITVAITGITSNTSDGSGSESGLSPSITATLTIVQYRYWYATTDHWHNVTAQHTPACHDTYFGHVDVPPQSMSDSLKSEKPFSQTLHCAGNVTAHVRVSERSARSGHAVPVPAGNVVTACTLQKRQDPTKWKALVSTARQAMRRMALAVVTLPVHRDFRAARSLLHLTIPTSEPPPPSPLPLVCWYSIPRVCTALAPWWLSHTQRKYRRDTHGVSSYVTATYRICVPVEKHGSATHALNSPNAGSTSQSTGVGGVGGTGQEAALVAYSTHDDSE
jgi:hypothetical protein